MNVTSAIFQWYLKHTIDGRHGEQKKAQFFLTFLSNKDSILYNPKVTLHHHLYDYVTHHHMDLSGHYDDDDDRSENCVSY